MTSIDDAGLRRWLERYGAAWETRDADAAASLFAPDATYQDTPFAAPFEGRAGIHEYWTRVTTDQRDIEFGFVPIATAGDLGIAQWSARFHSVAGNADVELNGVFVLEFADAEHVRALREWWHVR